MRDLMRAILEQYQLDVTGIHGLAHWARVCSNGLHLAEREGVESDVIELFALFHDACRENDGHDDEHGLRAAHLAESFRGAHYELPDDEFRRLQDACVGHSKGLLHADPVVEICWDADRLDLTRIGIQPIPGLLCTASARAVAEGMDVLPEFGEDAFLVANWGVDEFGEETLDPEEDWP